MPPRKRKKNEKEQLLLFVFFWLAVISVTIGLYTRTYLMYSIARVFVAPILLLRLVRFSFFKKVSLFIYISFFFTILADLFTLYGSYPIAHIGLSFYTINYLSISCYLHHLYVKKNGNNVNRLYILLVIIVVLLDILWLKASHLRYPINIAQVMLHALSIIYLSVGAFTVKNKSYSKKDSTLFPIVAVVIIFTNIVYLIDVLYCHRKYAILDSIVGFGNGLYLFLLTRSVLRMTRNIANSDEARDSEIFPRMD